jgi:hypothetical protein
MLIKVEPSGHARLEDQDNFRAFKVLCTATVHECESALGTVGRLDGDHLWVSRAWVESHGPSDETWRTGLRKMLDYAAASGWTDGTGAIRAHIEIGAAA